MISERWEFPKIYMTKISFAVRLIRNINAKKVPFSLQEKWVQILVLRCLLKVSLPSKLFASINCFVKQSLTIPVAMSVIIIFLIILSSSPMPNGILSFHRSLCFSLNFLSPSVLALLGSTIFAWES